jgi:hypothetical protein
VGSEISQRLIEAQQKVSLGQGEAILGNTENQFYDALRTATSTDEVDALFDGYPKKVADALAPFEKDHHVARALTLYSEQQAVTVENSANVTKARIIAQSDAIVRSTNGQTYKQTAIQELLAGGKTHEGIDREELMVRASESIGTILPAEADKELQKWHHDVQMGAIEARINDSNPSNRQDLIKQLGSGKGPLVDGLSEATRNQMLVAAESRNRELTNLAEAQDVNTNFGKLLEYFKTNQTTFADPESKVAATANPDVLKAIGVVNAKGEPDFVAGHKLLEYVEPLVADQERADLEKANKDRDEVYDLFAGGKISEGLDKAHQYLPDFEKAKRDDYPTIVNTARSWATWERTEAREGRTEARQGRMEARQAWQDRSDQTTSEISRRILDGEKLDLNKDIRGLAIGKEPQLTPHDASELEKMYKQSPQGGKPGASDPGYKLLTDSLPKPSSGGDPEESARTNLDNFLTIQTYQAMIKGKPHSDEGNLKAADTVLQQNIQKAIGRMIDKQVLSIYNPEAVKQFNEIGINLSGDTHSNIPSGPGYPTPEVPGNIQWNNRPSVQMPGGKPPGTVYSASREENGLEVLFPMIYEGKLHSEDEAWKHYKDTGEHMGKFKNAVDATAYAKKYHEDSRDGKFGKSPLPSGAKQGTLNGKHGYVLNGEFHAD